MRDAFIQELSLAAENDPDVVLITGDLGFGVLTEFQKRFPNQYFNAGVAEQNMTALAAGLALEGARVFTYSIANFTTLRCLEQLRNDVCYHGLNVTAVAVGGGFSYGQLGMSHFATEDISILRSLPEMRVLVPSDKQETKRLTREIVQSNGPAYLRIDKSTSGLEEEFSSQTSMGMPRVLRQGTSDVVILSCGGICEAAIDAHELLAKDGVDVTVVAVHSFSPVDQVALADFIRNKRVVTLEEHVRTGGLASLIADISLEQNAIPISFKAFAIPDQFPSIVGSQSFLRKYYGLTGQKIFDYLIS